MGHLPEIVKAITLNSKLAESREFVAADLDGKRDRARIRIAAALDSDDLVDRFLQFVDEAASLHSPTVQHDESDMVR